MYRRPSGFQSSGIGFPPLTPMVRNLIVACAVVWFLQVIKPGAFDALMVQRLDFGIWQPFTYMWLHSTNSLLHLLSNMFSLYMFGGALESVWGGQRFLRFYLACGVFAGFVIAGWDWLQGNFIPTLGASGAIFGVLTAYSLTWPSRTIMLLFPPIPLKAIYLIPLLFLLQFGMEGVSHIGHFGGVVAALLLLRPNLRNLVSLDTLRYRWHRYRMRGRLRAVRREEWQRRHDDRDGPTLH